MTAVRFSLPVLLAWISVIAVCCVALANAGIIWQRIVWTSAIMLGMTSIVGTIVCRGERRIFWIGFAVFFWSLLLLPTFPPLKTRMSLRGVLWDVHELVQVDVTYGGPGNPPLDTAPDLIGDSPRRVNQLAPAGTYVQKLPLRDPFIAVCTSLCLIACGLIGGVVARWMAVSRSG